MIDAVCTYGNKKVTYSILVFQGLSETNIEKYRQYLQCSECKGKAFFRRKSKDGKSACFGSRYHLEGCNEGHSPPQREREVKHAVEVNKIITDSDKVIFDFFHSESKQAEESKGYSLKPNTGQTGTSKSHSGTSNQSRIQILGMEKALNSLMRGSNLAISDIPIEIDEGYKFKAKNLFVNFADAEAADSLKNARPKMYWGTISHSDKDLDWLNPSDCNDVGIPIKKYKNAITKRFKIDEKRDWEGAGLMLFGRCFWNSQKNRKIIELWNADRIFISVVED